MKEACEKAAVRLAELTKPNEDAFLESVPGMKRLRGRALYAWYEETDDAYWMALYAEFPDRARDAVREWADLIKRYG